MKETANSNPTNPMKIPKGIKVKTATTKLPENNLYKKVDKILSKVCPATILAKSLIPKLPALAP